MNSRLAKLRKSLVLLSMGGATFHFSLLTPSLFNCDRNLQNADLQGFWTGVGNGVVETQVDNVFDSGVRAGVIGSDGDEIFREPLIGLGQAFWSNYVFLAFPQDAPIIVPLEE